MTIQSLKYLSSPEGKALLTEYQTIPTQDLPVFLMKLKKKETPFASELIDLLTLRAKALPKFKQANQLFFTRDGLEQSSGEIFSHYIANRFAKTLGNGASVIDLTCGIGGNSLFFAQKMHVTMVDIDPVHLECARLNAVVYGIDQQCTFLNQEAEESLRKTDAFFIDPQRIRSGKTKTRSIFNSQPNFVELLPKMLEIAKAVCVKISPAFNYEELATLPYEFEIEMVSEKNTNKAALLWFGDFVSAKRRATIVHEDGECTSFTDTEIVLETLNSIPPYLYLPNKSITKMHLVDEVGSAHGMKKVMEHSVWLGSEGLLTYRKEVFRSFEVIDYKPFSKRETKALLAEHRIDRAHIIARDFIDSPEHLRKTYKLKEGGDYTLIFGTLTNNENSVILVKNVFL